jgi:uncharacterized protein YggU (UPF0235/DUF167 family)
VKAAPTQGRANSAVCTLLSKALGVSGEDVEIRSGARSRSKLIAIDGMSQEELEAKLGKPTATTRAAC